jgi:hypothetical protein
LFTGLDVNVELEGKRKNVKSEKKEIEKASMRI